MMKKIYLLSAIAFGLIAISSCNNELDEITSAKLGAIRFGVSTSYQNGPDTKTAYTGVDEHGNPISTASAYERIEWLNTDKIRILCPQATVEGSSDKFADYSIAPTVANASTADIAPVSGDGLQWGEGTHTFFAVYPSPEQNSSVSLTVNAAGTEANIIYTIPEVQEVTLEPGTRNFKPNMDYAYMYAVGSGTPGSSIQLDFKPLVTAIEFTLLADDLYPSNLTSVRITQRNGGRIAGTLRSGAMKLSSTGEVTTTITGRTVSSSSSSIEINFPGDGVQLSSSPEEAYTVTFLCLPVEDLSNIEILLIFADDSHRRLLLADTYETSTLVFPAFTKSYIRNVCVPFDDVTLETPLSFQVHTPGITTVTVNDAYSNIQYRINKGEWADVTDYSFELNVGDVIQFRGSNAAYFDPDSKGNGRPFITSVDNNIYSGSLYVYGNIMSMIDPVNYPTLTELTAPNAFNSFFRGMKITAHTRKGLLLPATTITPGCYYGLFQSVNVTSYSSIPLILPELPATVLADSCYAYMFTGCKYVSTAPTLPATTLAKSCYEGMFRNCTSLTTAPELPATTLAKSCYEDMFRNCTSLTTAPELPATTAAESCYKGMFQSCVRLTTAPALPATTTAKSCYQEMFEGCMSLTTAPDVLPATSAAESCYQGMFYNCPSLTTAPALPATTTAKSCYQEMFFFCKSLTTAPDVLPATSAAAYCYKEMFYNCTSLTAAPDISAETVAVESCRSMFRSCTSLTAAPELPATTVDKSCYYGMFYNCSSLTSAPTTLPFETAARQCCAGMFYGCTSLPSAPELPATTVADSCYTDMFYKCTSLTTAPVIAATTLAPYCYDSMFWKCSSLTTVPEILPATTLAEYCYRSMFQECSSLTTAPVLPAPAMKYRCYYEMFKDCTSLNYAKCLAERDFVDHWNEELQRWEVGCISYMFENVSPTGTFVKKRGVNWHNIDPGTLYGWTVVEVDE